MKKISTYILIGCLSLMCLSATAFAATSTFSSTLKAKQKDTEVSTIRKATDTQSFKVTITDIGKDESALCVWTEGDLGKNFSSPYNQMGVETKSFDYTKTARIGKNITLNIDNPVYRTYAVPVVGEWTPN